MGVCTAWRYVDSVDLIDLDELASLGVRCLLLDRDNTLVPRDATVAPPSVAAWLDHARELGLGLCIVSNNFHSKDVERSARELGCEVVHHAMKPAPFAVWAALRKMGVSRDEAVLVGDQLFTDVAGGTFSGVRTILVRPQSTKDLWYTQLFRVVERRMLKDAKFKSAADGGDARP